jgi:hypothetical protein
MTQKEECLMRGILGSSLESKEVLSNQTVAIRDGANLDSFSRLRVSNPSGLWQAQMTYNIPSLVYESIITGVGAAIAYDATNRRSTHTFASTANGGKAYLQSYEYIPYQPGKSQLALVTFNFIEPAANTLKFAGLSDGTNGIEFQQYGSVVQVVLYSSSTNGNQVVPQSAWNIDKLDGEGISGITLDLTKTQILVIDFQALYAGRVRVGFDIDGSIVYFHQFLHANRVATPYIAEATLPIRCGMTCNGTSSTTMRFICASVISEGGQEDAGSYYHSIEGTGTAGNNTPVHILSIRPKLLFNSIKTRVKFNLDSIDFAVTGNTSVKFQIVIGQAISGNTTFSDVNLAYSAFEYNVLGTISGSPGLIVSNAYCASTNQTKTTITKTLASKYPISLDASGAQRTLGTVSILATGLGATSACRAILNWKEIR